MRKVLAALALAVLPLTGAASLSACASFEAPQPPKSPRQLLADAEVALIGAINITGALRSNGYLSPGRTHGLIETFARLGGTLDTAHTLLAAGKTAAAKRTASEILAELSRIAFELSLVAENAQRPATPPAPAALPSRWEI